MSGAAELRAMQVSAQLRLIADHLDLLNLSVAMPATTADGGEVQLLLQQALGALSANPTAARSTVRSDRPCLLLQRLRVDATTLIMTYLDTASMARFAATCRALQQLMRKSDHIWRTVSEHVLPLWYSQVRYACKPSVTGMSVWRKLFIDRMAADGGWRLKPRETTLTKRFLRGIHSLCFDQDTLLLGSGQWNEVLCYDLKTARPRSGASGAGMFGHTQAVTGLRPLPDNKLLTSSLDTSLRLFNRSTMQMEKVYNGHTDKVWCLDVYENRIFSGSSDKTVRIWDMETTESIAEPLRSHRTSISAIRVVKTLPAPLLFTGSAGNTIRVWDIAESTPRCIEKLRGHTKGVFSLQSTPAVLMSGSLDNVIKVWDPRQGFRLIYELRQKDANGNDLVAYTDDQETNIGVISFQCDDTKVVSGGPDRIVRVWDLRMRQIVNELEGHTHWITTLQFDDNKIITGSRDKTVRCWDMSGRMLEDISINFHDHDDAAMQLPPPNMAPGQPGTLLPAPAVPPQGPGGASP